MLNTSLANRAIENSIYSRKLAVLGKRKSIKKEYTIDGYKTDFYIPNTKTVIEIKSIISSNEIAIFPTVYSERTINQLSSIEKLLKKGYKAHFIIVSLNPYVKEIKLLKDTVFYKKLSFCIELGLNVTAFSCKLTDTGIPQIHKKISWT